MIDSVFAPLGVLVLRWFVAAMLLDRAWTRLRVLSLQGSARQFEARGLVPALAYLMLAAEVVGAACLMLGIYPRLVALLLALLLISTISMANGPHGWLAAGRCGTWRFPALFAVLLLTLTFLGDGPVTLVGSPGFGT